MASPFLLAAGGFTQGLAQGAQAGTQMAYQYQSMQLQKQQMNLATTQGMVNALKIPNAAMRTYAVGKMMTGYGMDPNSPDGKNFLKAIQNADDASIKAISDGFAQAGITMSPEMVGQYWRQDPAGALQMLTNLQLNKQTANIMNQALGGPADPTAGGTAPPATSPTGGSTAAAAPTDVSQGGSVPAVGGTTTQQTSTAPPAPVAPTQTPSTTQATATAPATQTQQQQTVPARPTGSVSKPTSLTSPVLQIDKNGVPLPWNEQTDPVIAKLNAAYAAVSVSSAPNKESVMKVLQSRIDEYSANMKNQFDEQMARLNLQVAQGHLSIDAFNAATQRAEANFRMSTPFTPEGKAIADAKRNNLDPNSALPPAITSPYSGTGTGGGGTFTSGGGAGGGAGTGTAQAPATSTAPAVAPATGGGTKAATPSAATSQAPSPQSQLQPGQVAAAQDPNDPWGYRKTIYDNMPYPEVRALDPDAKQIVKADGTTTYQLATATSFRDPKDIANAQMNLTANSAGYDITGQVLKQLGEHPGEFATGGELKSLYQATGAAARNLIKSLTPGAADPYTDALYHKFFDYNKDIPALTALNHQVEYLVAMQLRASGGAAGGMMGMEDAMKAAEGMVGDWQSLTGSPEAIAAHLQTVNAFFARNIAGLRDELPINSVADPASKISAQMKPVVDTGQTQTPASSTTEPPPTEQTAAPSRITAPSSSSAAPAAAPAPQPLTGLSKFPNLGGSGPGKFIPNNQIAILQNALKDPTRAPRAKANFDALWGTNASAMVAGTGAQ